MNWPDFKFPGVNLWNLPQQYRDYVYERSLNKERVPSKRENAIAKILEDRKHK
jgi:hypothetical protein